MSLDSGPEEPATDDAGAAMPPSPWRRRLKLALAGVAVLVTGFLLFLNSCVAVPPTLEGRPAILDAEVTVGADGRRTLGKSWFLAREGASQLYVEGEPFTLGYSNAELTKEFMQEQERSLIGTVREFFPSPVSFLAVATMVLINNRSLPSFVSEEHQMEILGLSMAGDDPYPQYGSRYHRILNYHAAHDISHWVWDKPIVGCTSFAARGAKTQGGALLVGRNFDFEAGRHFDTNKIIGVYKPTRGQAFLSVSWPGMAGAVTGINEQKIFCSINGAHSEQKGRIGKPVSLVVREVLQDAESLQDAIRIIRESQVFVTDGYLIADGKTGEAAVVEKSPGRSEVRTIANDQLLQANHFEAAGFKADTGNTEHFKEGTTASRRARLEELVTGSAEVLTPEGVARILRDVRGPGGVELALGNRGSINAMIATHAVVADVTRGILWVSRGPHQLGQFDAYSIEAFGGAAPAPPIPEDPLLSSGAYERLCKARGLVKRAEESEAGEDLLREALALNPGDPKALFLLGEALVATGKPAEARIQFEAALAASPPFRAEIDAIKSALAALE